MGEKSKAIENFEKYKGLVNDTVIIKSIDEHIKELKNQP
jgi:diaminopimelate epimerase